MRINPNTITERHKLIINKGLLDYEYIMNHWHNNDNDFKMVYYDFYLKARWSVMANSAYSAPYFAKLQSISPNDDLISIIKDLSVHMPKNSLEFSLCSKLLHTRNDKFPIYDSKVRKYLSKEEGVNFKCGYGKKSDINMIAADWDTLCNWYKDFLKTQDGKSLINWFDQNFPAYADNISNVKKIDFIIFAAT